MSPDDEKGGLTIGLKLGKPEKAKDSAPAGPSDEEMAAAREEALREFFAKGAEGDYAGAHEAWNDYRAACEES